MLYSNALAGEQYFIEWDDRWSDDSFIFEIALDPMYQNNGGTSSLDMMVDMEMSVYPNPNDGEAIFIALSNMAKSQNSINLEVLDVFGKKVFSKRIAGSNETNRLISLNLDLAQGLYFVNVLDGEVVKTQKLIVE